MCYREFDEGDGDVAADRPRRGAHQRRLHDLALTGDATALERRFNRKVRMQTDVDPSLIGGAVVRAGDLTIDGSVKARLTRLAHDLTA